MNAKWFLQMFPLVLLNTAIALFIAGCASTPMRSFNQDYDEHFPASPKYAIQNMDDNHFRILLNQGTPLQGPARILYMKEAASAIADAESKRRGWQRWDLNYIQERDQGWMHVLIAEVNRTK